MNRGNPPRPKCPVCRARKLPTLLLCPPCSEAFGRIPAAPGESTVERLYRLADWAIRRAVRLERARAREKSLRAEAAPRNDSLVYRAALNGLGRMHREAPPPCVREAGYDMAAAWSGLSNERRGEAVMACLAAVGEVEDCGGSPGWMTEYESEWKRIATADTRMPRS